MIFLFFFLFLLLVSSQIITDFEERFEEDVGETMLQAIADTLPEFVRPVEANPAPAAAAEAAQADVTDQVALPWKKW